LGALNLSRRTAAARQKSSEQPGLAFRTAWGNLRRVEGGGIIKRLKPWGGAVLAGLVWTLAFPHVALALAGWLAPALLVALCHGPRFRRVFALGYVAGLAQGLSSLYWVLLIPYPPGAVAGWLALSAYCALYPALWVWFCWWRFPVRDLSGLAEAWLRLRHLPWRDRVLWPLQCALGWVALEQLRGWLLTGFPWNYLAHSQLDLMPLALVASLTGVLGVSLLVAWGSMSFLVATTGSVHLRGRERWRRIGLDAGPVLGFMVLLLGLAWWQVEAREKQLKPRGTVRIAMVQPSIPQQVIWESYGSRERMIERWELLRELTIEAARMEPDVIIWPEASAPLSATRDANGRVELDPIDELARTLGVPMIVGTDEAVLDSQGNRRMARNSCFHLDANGTLQASYSKQHLVMFGEYVPFGGVLPFLKKLAPVGTFTAGEGPVLFDLGGVKAAPVICFEDVLPSLVRRAAVEEADFILNLTNDGWFGESNQQWQHARAAAFRAIETGRPLVRCTNNGLTCWVDWRGRIHRLEKGSIYEKGVRIMELPVMDAAGAVATFHQRTGDWLGWACVLASGAFAAARWRPKKDSAGEADMA
tara:strand:- start:546 stop:2312 length:1767 start_codon:yes stop_codon:yes gene_type:complete